MSTKAVKIDPIAKAIYSTLESPNECDSNLESANVVDGLFAIARALDRVAKAISNKGVEREKPNP